MADLFIQYSSATSGTITAQDTKQDSAIIHNNGSLAVTLTIAFPAAPRDGQRFIVVSALGVTTLTLSSAITIIGGITALSAGGFATWIYSTQANKWFRFG